MSWISNDNLTKMVLYFRDTYDQLNHFTTEQLVILRREIVKICRVSKADPTAQVYPLLQHVRANCSPEDLTEAIHKADR